MRLLLVNDFLRPSLQDSTRFAWSEQTTRDSVAAIARGAGYHRQLTESLWSRVWRWVLDRVSEFFSYMSGLRYGREITIALFVVVVLLLVVRLLMGLRDERMSRSGASRGRSRSSNLVVLSDAQRLAAAGDFTAAAHALFQALIAASASRGEVRVHPSKTTGDYARELRRRNVTWLRNFQSFRSRYDRVMYGDMTCSADDYRALENDARFALTVERAA